MNAAVTGAVILGAGFSRRFGDADKRLAVLPSGLTVAEATVQTYCDAFSACRVVLRTDDQALAERLQSFPVELVFTADAAGGMGHSLAAGVRGVSWTWTFIALLDMPFVRVQTLRALIDATEQRTGIVRPRYIEDPDAPAHPIGFHRALLPELAESSGDEGARRVLKLHSDECSWVDCDDAGVIRDIDAPADLQHR